MWIDLNNFSQVTMTPLELFQHYTFVNIYWLLCSMIYGSQSAFVDGWIHVVEDQLCVNLIMVDTDPTDHNMAWFSAKEDMGGALRMRYMTDKWMELMERNIGC